MERPSKKGKQNNKEKKNNNKKVVLSKEVVESKYPPGNWEWSIERFTVAFGDDNIVIAGLPSKSLLYNNYSYQI